MQLLIFRLNYPGVRMFLLWLKEQGRYFSQAFPYVSLSSISFPPLQIRPTDGSLSFMRLPLRCHLSPLT